MQEQEFKQKVLDAIKATLEQGEKSTDSHEGCFYRTTNNEGKNLCCVVGHMIPEGQYTKYVDYPPDDSDAGVRENKYIQELLGIAGDDQKIEFLYHLQRCHDDAVNDPWHFKESFKNRIYVAVDANELPKWVEEALQ